MDKAAAKDNLFKAVDIMEKHGIRMFLMYGTLLGAIREGDFIDHDDDMDVGLFEADREAFAVARKEMESLGFVVSRQREGRVFDIVRNDIGLDFFFVREKKNLFGRRYWDLDGRTSIAARHLDGLDTMDFLGRPFLVPRDRVALMKRLYGPNWRIPVADKPANMDFRVRVRKYLVRTAKKFFGKAGRRKEK